MGAGTTAWNCHGAGNARERKYHIQYLSSQKILAAVLKMHLEDTGCQEIQYQFVAETQVRDTDRTLRNGLHFFLGCRNRRKFTKFPF